MKKRFLCAILTFIIVIVFSACGNEVNKESAEVTALRNKLQELYERYCSGEEFVLKDYMITENLEWQFEGISEEYVAYYEDYNSSLTKGIALHRNGMLFVGEFENEKLNGQGICYGSYKSNENDVTLKCIEGEFKDGIPHGYCVELQDLFGPLNRINYTYEGNYDFAVRTGTFKLKSKQYNSMDFCSEVLSGNFSYENDNDHIDEVIFGDVLYIDGVAQINSDYGTYYGEPLVSKGINITNHYITYSGEKDTAFLQEW